MPHARTRNDSFCTWRVMACREKLRSRCLGGSRKKPTRWPSSPTARLCGRSDRAALAAGTFLAHHPTCSCNARPWHPCLIDEGAVQP